MSVEDCPDCRKLQSECETLAQELETSRDGERLLQQALIALVSNQMRRVEPDPRAPKPVYVPAAVPQRRPINRVVGYCAICDREHDVDRDPDRCRP